MAVLDVGLALLQDSAEAVRREAMRAVEQGLSPCSVELCMAALASAAGCPAPCSSCPAPRGAVRVAACPLLNAEAAVQVVVRHMCLRWSAHPRVRASLQSALRCFPTQTLNPKP